MICADVRQSVRKRANDGEPRKYEQQPNHPLEQPGDQSTDEGEYQAEQNKDQKEVHDAVPPILTYASVIVAEASRTVR